MFASFRRLLLRFVALFRTRRAEAELQREIAAHLQLLEDEYRARGMSETEAKFAAQRAFGGVAQVQEAQREVRTFRALWDLGLDLKLGWRMLRKYPGVTLVSALGIAVSIGIGAATFNGFYMTLAPKVALPEGEWLVSVLNWRAEHGRRGATRHADFVRWREEVRSLENLGAFRDVGRNLVQPDGAAEPVTIAEMTPSGFTAARVPALLGRVFEERDAQPGASGVLVISHAVWQSRFQGERAVLGREVRLGERVHTIIGVMPPGFAFPVAHDYWVPLVESAAVATNPPVSIFGRLPHGITLESAQAELTALGERVALDWPETHRALRPRVMEYPRPFSGTDDVTWTWVAVMQLLVTLLQVVVCANVAILIYARTLTRRGEIAVRTALGASRGRIVSQLFLEALVLAGIAAAAGLGLAHLAMQQIETVLRLEWTTTPFWVDFGLSPLTYLFGLGLAVLGAAICGLLPALKATGQDFDQSLRQLGTSGTKLGKSWTSLIVLQVAIAVAALPATLFTTWEAAQHVTLPNFASDELLVGSIALDPADSSNGSVADAPERRAALRAQLEQRLREMPEVVRLSVASAPPGDERAERVEVDATNSTLVVAGPARRAQIDGELLAQFGGTVLAGRALTPADLSDPARPVVVNAHFADTFFPQGNALGRRIRFATDKLSEPASAGEWREIVGVVSNVPAQPLEPREVMARVYEPLAAERFNVFLLAKVVPGTLPGAFTERLRAVAAGVDARIRVQQLTPLPAFYRQTQVGMRLVSSVLGAVTLSVVLLAAAGIYALMSFVVAQRRREIGIRAALGADPRQLVQATFARAAGQLALGITLGAAVALGMDFLSDGEMLRGHAPVLLPAVAALMLFVGALAALGPARRAVKIDPIETLRAE